MARLNHKRGRKSNYLKSLNNSNHKAARERCLLRDKFMCSIDGCTKKHGLEFHHIDYKVKGIELENGNLIWCVIVCDEHHQEIHDNINHPWNPKNYKKVNALKNK